MIRFSLVLLLAALAGRHGACAALQCVDESGKPVDWFVMYKLPANKGEGKVERNGLGYVQITSLDPDSGWKLSALSMDDPKSTTGRTLAPLYANNGVESLEVMYNDQYPEGKQFAGRAHSKGVVAADARTGFWLVHSVPGFPPARDASYSYPKSGENFGQSLLCISFNSSVAANIIGRQLMYNNPHVYSNRVPKDLAAAFPELASAAAGKHADRKAKHYNVAAFPSLGNVHFASFAKSKEFRKDLYSDLVAPALKTDLAVETWRRKSGTPINSTCGGPFKVENVEEVKITAGSGESFPFTDDHAKWAISLERERPFVCVGDINRMESQRKRGGGTVCLSMKPVWKAYYGIIGSLQPCPKKRGKGVKNRQFKKWSLKSKRN